MRPIEIPAEWHDHGLITFEEFCVLLHLPQRTVRDWRRRGVGPRWVKFDGTGPLYVTVVGARRFLASAATGRNDVHSGPIEIPLGWHDHGLITFEEFCVLLHLPQRTVRDLSLIHI